MENFPSVVMTHSAGVGVSLHVSQWQSGLMIKPQALLKYNWAAGSHKLFAMYHIIISAFLHFICFAKLCFTISAFRQKSLWYFSYQKHPKWPRSSSDAKTSSCSHLSEACTFFGNVYWEQAGILSKDEPILLHDSRHILNITVSFAGPLSWWMNLVYLVLI